MKTTFLRICLTALSSVFALSAANAQALPNGTLETWETRGAYQAPTSWFTTDDFLQAALPGFPLVLGATTRTTDKHGGTYAAKLSNTNSPLLGPVPGILGLGSTINVSSGTLGGIPFASRPARMEFYYKLTGANAADDSAAVQIVLTKTVNGQQNFVASGELLIVPAAGYTLATVPLDYASNLMPDSIQVLFLSSTQEEPLTGTSLFVDDIIMTGTVTSAAAAVHNAAVAVYPNPSASGLFTLTNAKEASWSRAAFTVTDLTGRVVLRQAEAPASTSGPRPVDLRGHRAGVYTLRLETPEGPVVQKLLIQ